MEKHLHPNYFKASRLMFLSGGIYIINTILTKDIVSVQSDDGLGVMIVGLLTFALALLIRRGHGWVKYLLLALTLLGLFFIQITVDEVKENPVGGIINIATTLIQVWAMVLLFMIPKRMSAAAEQG